MKKTLLRKGVKNHFVNVALLGQVEHAANNTAKFTTLNSCSLEHITLTTKLIL